MKKISWFFLFLFSTNTLADQMGCVFESFDTDRIMRSIKFCDALKQIENLNGRVECKLSPDVKQLERGLGDLKIGDSLGWVTVKNGKVEGPAEILYDHFLKLKARGEFVGGKLNGKFVLEEYPSGRCELQFKDGNQDKIQRKFSKADKLVAISYSVARKPSGSESVVEIDYGSGLKNCYARMKCNQKSYLPEDKEPCGHLGKDSVIMVGQGCMSDVVRKGDVAEVVIRDGRVKKTNLIEWDVMSQQRRRFEIKNGSDKSRSETIYTKDNKPEREFFFNGEKEEGRVYWPNGKLKSHGINGKGVGVLLYESFTSVGTKEIYLKRMKDQTFQAKFYAGTNFQPCCFLMEEGEYKSYEISKYLEIQKLVAPDSLFKRNEPVTLRRIHETFSAGLIINHAIVPIKVKRFNSKGKLESEQEFLEGVPHGKETDHRFGKKQVVQYDYGTKK